MVTMQFAVAPADQATLLASSIWYMGGLLTIHADGLRTNGQYSLIESVALPGTELPLHVHDREDEMVYLLDGTIRVTLGDQHRMVLPGETVFLPRRIPHTFRIVSESARALTLITPAGLEDFFRALGAPAESMTLPPTSLLPHITRVRGTAGRFGVTMLS